ncbi:hypothetical protein EC559_04500, partial [Vibrio parahaemolyticus]|nr:hypothetical protein [Vibrio parahaemolyticus]
VRPSLIIDWSPVQVWEGPPNSRRLVSVVFTNLFLYLTILGQVMGQVSPDHALFSAFFQY